MSDSRWEVFYILNFDSIHLSRDKVSVKVSVIFIYMECQLELGVKPKTLWAFFPHTEAFERVLLRLKLSSSLKRVHILWRLREEYDGSFWVDSPIRFWRSHVWLIVKWFFLNVVLELHSESDVAFNIWILYFQ